VSPLLVSWQVKAGGLLTVVRGRVVHGRAYIMMTQLPVMSPLLVSWQVKAGGLRPVGREGLCMAGHI